MISVHRKEAGMKDDTNPRWALVTGAATGIGFAVARALFDAGHGVVLLDIDGEGASRAAAEIDGTGHRVRAAQVDVRRKADIDRAVAGLEAEGLAIDILVNNAARTQARDFFDITEAEWDDVMNTNLRSMVFTVQAIAPGMARRGWGRIINMTSVAGQRGGPQVQGAHYSASKTAIIGLSCTLAHAFAPDGITVNAVAPGTIRTNQTKLAPPDKLKAVMKTIPLGRLGDSSEIGALVAFLVSDQGEFITGATLDVNGGLLMR